MSARSIYMTYVDKISKVLLLLLLSIWYIAFLFLGFSSKDEEVREFVAALTRKITPELMFDAQGVGNALYGLQKMSLEHYEVRQVNWDDTSFE